MTFEDGFAGRVADRREAILGEPDDDSMIGVPLLAGGELTGVLVVCAASPRRFSSDDLNLLRLAADRVALAIDHARLYERELRIAETLQRSLLPERLPQMPGLDVSARVPAGRGGSRGRRRLVRRAPDLRRRSRAGHGRHRRQGPRGGLDGGSPAQRPARLRPRGPLPGSGGGAAQPPHLDRRAGPPDGHSALRGRGPGRGSRGLGERRSSPTAADGRRRAAAFPGRREQRAPRRAAVSGFPGGVPDGGGPRPPSCSTRTG